MDEEIFVDNFAGGGGASTGIVAARGRPVDIAINHSPEAIAMHAANHPDTKHFCENIWEVDPREACGSRRVGLAWFSPDCTHFSKAKGGQPRSKEIRGLADVVIRWARAVRPRVIVVENVEEFMDWGPLGDDGKPVAARKGEDFRRWLGELTACGYAVEYRRLVAADYGTPTTRRRFVAVARCDGRPIVWPEPSHGKGRAHPWRPAAEIIDWSLPCPSIFARKRPLADATLRRIAAGLRRFVVESPSPFIVPVKTWGGGGNGPRSIDDRCARSPLRSVGSSRWCCRSSRSTTPCQEENRSQAFAATRRSIPSRPATITLSWCRRSFRRGMASAKGRRRARWTCNARSVRWSPEVRNTPW